MENRLPENHPPLLVPERELPSPHDMLLETAHPLGLPKPHLTQLHPWLHWFPAILGLLIGLAVGMLFVGGANQDQQITKVQSEQRMIQEQKRAVSDVTWKTYNNADFTFTYPGEWIYQKADTESRMRSAPPGTEVFELFDPATVPVITQAVSGFQERLTPEDYIALATFPANGQSITQLVDSVERAEKVEPAFAAGFNRKQTMIGGVIFEVYSTVGQDEYPWHAVGSDGKNIIEIGFSDDPDTHPVLKKMFSSFRFMHMNVEPTKTGLFSPTLPLIRNAP